MLPVLILEKHIPIISDQRSSAPPHKKSIKKLIKTLGMNNSIVKDNSTWTLFSDSKHKKYWLLINSSWTALTPGDRLIHLSFTTRHPHCLPQCNKGLSVISKQKLTIAYIQERITFMNFNWYKYYNNHKKIGVIHQ